jgi:hypothetical protein
MQRARSDLQRTLGQRFGLLTLVFALVFAPALASIWPALGRGEMLFVAAAKEAAHADHAAHEGHQAPAPASHHQQHCALCVLAFLGWAPPVLPGLVGAAIGSIERAVPIAVRAPHLPLAWSRAQARAPPRS